MGYIDPHDPFSMNSTLDLVVSVPCSSWEEAGDPEGDVAAVQEAVTAIDGNLSPEGNFYDDEQRYVMTFRKFVTPKLDESLETAALNAATGVSILYNGNGM